MNTVLRVLKKSHNLQSPAGAKRRIGTSSALLLENRSYSSDWLRPPAKRNPVTSGVCLDSLSGGGAKTIRGRQNKRDEWEQVLQYLTIPNRWLQLLGFVVFQANVIVVCSPPLHEHAACKGSGRGREPRFRGEGQAEWTCRQKGDVMGCGTGGC